MDKVDLVKWVVFAVLEFLAIFGILQRTSQDKRNVLRQSVVIWLVSIVLAVVVDLYWPAS